MTITPDFPLDRLPELAPTLTPTVELAWGTTGHLFTRFELEGQAFKVWFQDDGPCDDIDTHEEGAVSNLGPADLYALRNWAYHMHQRVQARVREAFYRLATPELQISIIESAR